MNIEITEEDIKRAQARMEDDEKRIKKAFGHIKQLSFKEFKKLMNGTNIDAYNLSNRQWREALEATLPPKQVTMVKEKFLTIQSKYDNIDLVEVKYEEFELYDLMQVVHKEMKRAAGIHGDAFVDYLEAKEAIEEEVAEVWEAYERGDVLHAKMEAIQAIGVLIKFIRTVG